MKKVLAVILLVGILVTQVGVSVPSANSGTGDVGLPFEH
jgi:hypothetical protein